MTKMIVGLGNPGEKYKETKHNIGFQTLDALAFRKQVAFKREKTFQADVASYFEDGEKIYLVKPMTFMNESGKAVGPLLTYFQVSLEDMVVVYDDLDLSTGQIRLRQKGGSGGHNGIKSLINHIGSEKFQRIKIGIGRPPEKMTVIHHVLGKFPKEVQEEVQQAVIKSVDAVDFFTKGKTFVETMNAFNEKQKAKI